MLRRSLFQSLGARMKSEGLQKRSLADRPAGRGAAALRCVCQCCEIDMCREIRFSGVIEDAGEAMIRVARSKTAQMATFYPFGNGPLDLA